MLQFIKVFNKKIILLFLKIINNIDFLETVKTLILRLFGIISLFGFTIYITNNYPIEIVGQYDFVRTYLLVIGCICMLGTDQSILYFAGFLRSRNDLAKINTVYQRMILMMVACSIILFLVFMLIGKYNINHLFKDIYLYNILLKSNFVVVCYAITLFNTEVMRSLDNIYLSELFRNTFKYITVILGSVILILINKQKYLVDVFLGGFVLLAIISSIIVCGKLRKIKSTIAIYYDNELLSYSNVLKKSYPIAISSAAIFLLTTFDVFFLKTNYGSDEVAKYSVGAKMMTIIAMIIQMINVNASSKIAKCYAAKDYVGLQDVVKNAVRMTSLFSVPIVIILVFLSNFILNFFGRVYHDAKYSMIILVSCQGMIALFGVSTMYLNMTERQFVFQYLLIFAVVFNFFLNFILTPVYGMIGASISFGITLLFWNIFVVVYVFKKDNIKLYLH